MARIHRGTIQKDLLDPDDHDGMIAHLEPDNLECKVNWALRNITMNIASGGDGIPAELSQILKDNELKVLHSVIQEIWKTQQWPRVLTLHPTGRIVNESGSRVIGEEEGK